MEALRMKQEKNRLCLKVTESTITSKTHWLSVLVLYKKLE